MVRMDREERISDKLDALLLEDFKSGLAGYPADEKERVLKEYEKFRMSGTTRNRAITYNQLSDFLLYNKKDLNYVLKISNCEVKKDERALRIVKVLSNLPQEQILKVERLINDLTDLSWFDRSVKRMSPTEKVHLLISQKVPRWKRRNLGYLPPSALHSWSDQHKGTKVDTEDLSAVAEYFSVSPHYLVGISADVGYYAKSPLVEEMIDKFCFIPERMRDEIALAVERGYKK